MSNRPKLTAIGAGSHRIVGACLRILTGLEEAVKSAMDPIIVFHHGYLDVDQTHRTKASAMQYPVPSEQALDEAGWGLLRLMSLHPAASDQVRRMVANHYDNSSHALPRVALGHSAAHVPRGVHRPSGARGPSSGPEAEPLFAPGIFDHVCEGAVDWLHQATPAAAATTEDAMTADSGCPRSSLACAAHVRSTYFTKHLPLGFIHVNWGARYVGLITHMLRDLHCHPHVHTIEVDRPVSLAVHDDDHAGQLSHEHISNDPLAFRQWYLRNQEIKEVWEVMEGSRSQPVNVMVADSGVATDHEDLKANLLHWSGKAGAKPKEAESVGAQSGSGGAVSVIAQEESPDDKLGHGTHCTGVIAAEVNNGLGVAGITNNHVKVFMCKFLSKEKGQISNAVKCLDMAMSGNFSVVSGSWGGPSRMEALTTAIEELQKKDTMVIVAAGNGGQDLNEEPFWPACERFPHMLTVTAVQEDDVLGSYSNFGDKCVQLAAPGDKIFSTIVKDGHNAYGTKSGTSMAVPIVAAAAANVRVANPALTAIHTSELLQKTVRPVVQLDKSVAARGTLDTHQALLGALATTIVFSSSNASSSGSQEGEKVAFGQPMTLKPEQTGIFPVLPTIKGTTLTKFWLTFRLEHPAGNSQTDGIQLPVKVTLHI
ncbi:putative peptidase [Gregarina niphandrodes]|uniref:subtilisin n=1 Tax=Gregarina niphandrodes TaxID=110365 RepID=A0A023BDQ9_GRENI|nr:putative peptidase [Gregarina niphandrodes]EZG88390.1 putative peptidase [Gregarina niphandrodes]|eukprot:XP_011128564.1 putative peptidase [Gregarina niphandrodes]